MSVGGLGQAWGFFVIFFSWFFNKNDKTQNTLLVNFGGRLCFAPGIPLSFIDYLANVLQGLFYMGLNSCGGHRGIFFVLGRSEFLDFSTTFVRKMKV